MTYKTVSNILSFLDELGEKQVTIRGVNYQLPTLCFLITAKTDKKNGNTVMSVVDHDGFKHVEDGANHDEALNLCLVKWFNAQFARFTPVQELLRKYSYNGDYQGLIVYSGGEYALQHHPNHQVLKLLANLGFSHKLERYPLKASKEVLYLKQDYSVFKTCLGIQS